MKNDTILEAQALAPLEAPNGRVPEFRIKSPDVARQLYASAFEQDRECSIRRAIVMGVLRGMPPWKEDELSKTNSFPRTNSNFRDAKTAFENITSSFLDLLFSSPELISVETDFGDTPEKRAFYNEALSKIITKEFLRWPEFVTKEEQLCLHSIYNGFGIVFFPDSKEWTYEIAGLDDFKFEPESYPDVSKLECVFASRKIKVQELYAKIQDEDIARDSGWDVDSVKNLLMYHANDGNSRVSSWNNWIHEFENGRFYSLDNNKNFLTIVYCYVKEFDGSITQQIFFEEAIDKENEVFKDSFLYEKRNEYTSMEEAFVLFPLSSSSFIENSKGLGDDLLPHFTARNRILSQAIDSTLLGLSMLVRPETEMATIEAALAQNGATTFVHPEVSIEPAQSPDVSRVAGTTLALLDNSKSQRLGDFNILESSPESRNILESEAKLGEASKVSISIAQKYFSHRTKLHREIVRRIIDRDYIKAKRKGSSLIKNILKRLRQAGIDEEAFYQIDPNLTMATTPLGYGSSFQRRQSLNVLQQIKPTLDKKGQDFLTKMFIEAYASPDFAERLMPSSGLERVDVSQQKIAILENDDLNNTVQVPVLDTEDHFVHAQEHAGLITSLIEAAKEDNEQLADIAIPLEIALQHFSIHLEYLASQPEPVPAYAAVFIPLTKQANEYITNGRRALEARIRKEQESSVYSNNQQFSQNDLAIENKRKEYELKEEHLKRVNEIRENERESEVRAKQALNDLAIAKKAIG